jgi:hypothetical protein
MTDAWSATMNNAPQGRVERKLGIYPSLFIAIEFFPCLSEPGSG